jgi:hypothetical protein
MQFKIHEEFKQSDRIGSITQFLYVNVKDTGVGIPE